MNSILTALVGVFVLSNSVAAPATVAAPITPETEASQKVAVQVDEPVKEVQRYTVKVTAYNAVPAQTDDDPSITASGARSNPELIVARSRDLASELPFGTVVAFERAASDTPNCRFEAVEHLIGYRVVGDTMASRWTKKMDILFDQHDTVSVNGREHNPSIAMGICNEVTVRVVGHIDIKDIPSTQAELAEMFGEGKLALAK